MVNLIGLYSPAMQSGKSTVSKYLSENAGFIVVKFADPLKEMIGTLLCHMIGLNECVNDYIEGNKKEVVIKPFGVTARNLMQTLGTEWGRKAVYENFWVDITVNRIKEELAFGNKVVVEDMRFPNEFDAVKAFGGETWKIERPSAVYTGGHASEGALNNNTFDATFVNQGTIEDLHRLVHMYMGSN